MTRVFPGIAAIAIVIACAPPAPDCPNGTVRSENGACVAAGVLVPVAVIDPPLVDADPTRYWFVGHVYDGATGERIRGYRLELRYFGRIVDAEIDQIGRYFVGPLEPGHDFSIIISVDGYRSFFSHNAKLADIGDTDTSMHFDAYVFPEGLEAPADEVTVRFGDDPDSLPAGQVRFRPTSESTLIDDADETPAGVGAQLWRNDDNTQFATMHKSFVDGRIPLDPGQLIYGVSYEVRVFGVDGYRDAVGLYTAGLNDGLTLVLQNQAPVPLELVFMNVDLGDPVPDGVLQLVFNQPIEFDPLQAEPYPLAVIALNSPDADGDFERNTLTLPTTSTVTIQDDVLTVEWDESASLDTTDPDDPIFSITYGGFGAMRIRPVGGDLASTRSLNQVTGVDAVTVPLVAQ